MRNIILGLLAAALIVSLGLNLYGFDLLTTYYRDLNAVRLQPFNLDAFPPLSDQAASGSTVVFYGDSRAQNWPAPDLNGFTFINRGIGNQTSAQVALRFDAHVLPLRPDYLLLQVGVNDLKAIPLFPDQRDQIIRQVQANITSIVERAQALNAQVIVTTIFPVGDVPWQRRLVWSDGVAVAVREVNDFLRTLDDVILLDTYALLADENGLLRPDFSLDELHLNDEGYAVLNIALVDLLQGGSVGTD
jgi:lysophospholipase L1-like esterase